MAAVEQGLSVRVVERGHPLEDPNREGEFRQATVYFLGYSPGVEWLHDEANRRISGESQGWFTIESGRRSAHFGAGGEVAHVVIELLGAGVAGKVISDLIDYAREQIRKWREPFEPGFDSPPDFTRYDSDSLDNLLDRLRGELAEIINVPLEKIGISRRKVETRHIAEATFLNAETGDEYEVAIERSTVTFTRRRPE